MSYSPSGGAVSKQLPFGMSNLPLDAKLMYDDQVNFTKRAFISTAEILTYFPAGSPFRNGNFEILLNTGGTLSNGVITGGVESIWWFSGGTADVNLIQKYYTTLQVDQLLGENGSLPVGELGQIIKVNTNNTNEYVSQDTILTGNYINTDEELEIAKTVFVTQAEIFNTWKRFAHGNANSGDQSSGTKGNKIPGLPISTNAWNYDSILDRINSTFNSWCMLGFISKIKLNKYTHKATVGSTAADNDKVGLVLSFVEDESDLVPNTAFGLNPADFNWPINVTDEFIPNQHALTLIRNREPNLQGVIESYVVYYDYQKLTEKIVLSGTSLLEVNPTTNWLGSTVDLEVVRDNDIFTIRTSRMSDVSGGKGPLGYTIILDLNSDPDLLKFKGYHSYGYACQSQANSYYSNISIQAGLGVENEIYDLRNGDIWVADSEGVYSISPTRVLWNELLPRTLVRNTTTEKYFYIDSNYEYDLINDYPVPPIITTDNGLTKTDNNIRLGGSIVTPLVIGQTNTSNKSSLGISNTDLNLEVVGTSNQHSSLLINKDRVSLSARTETIDLRSITLPSVSGQNMVILDGITSRGFVNGGDYEANFVPRSLITQQYLASQLGAYELFSNKVGNLTSPNANTYINTLGLSNLLSIKVNTSTAITGGYGVTIGGDLSSAVSVTLNTSVVDNRYLRKDIADNNGSFKLTTGSFETGVATINDDLFLPSLGVGTSDDILVIDGTGLVQKKTLVIAGDFGVANAAGSNQFDVALGTDLRFEGANDTTVTFDPTTKKVTISSVPGSGGGGAVVSWNARTGAVIPLSGDYNTSQVTELTNLYFTNARVLTVPLTGLSASNVAITATDTVIQGFNKAQGQINNLVPITRTITIGGTAGRVVIGGGDTQELSANRAWTIDLVTTGTAGTYKSVTTDAYGRVIAGTNPTTLSAFGITDAYTKTEADAKYYLQTNPAGYITTADLTPYVLKSNFEKIPFTGATGTINIDFTINSRQSKFPNPDIRAYNVSGSIEDKIIGFNEQITRSGANISTVELNYISGDGYILITNN